MEQKGLKWLEEKTAKMDIVITQVDKGGSILIVPPSLMENKIKEKITDNAIFKKLNKDPRQDLYDKLHNHWKIGKTNKFVTEKEAEKIVGVTSKNNKSTSSLFKPGETYFHPSLKIHKMNEAEIKPGCDPPARLISCLQEGVTKRSDVFVAEKWLKNIESDFCSDIVKDTNSTLIWLDEVNSRFSESQKKNFIPFTFDFQALYDLLTPI